MSLLLFHFLHYLLVVLEVTNIMVYLHDGSGRRRTGLTTCCVLTVFVWAAVPATESEAQTDPITVDKNDLRDGANRLHVTIRSPHIPSPS